MSNNESRRNFLKSVGATGVSIGAAAKAFAAKSSSRSSGRVIGANDRINVALIGCGGRGRHAADTVGNLGQKNNSCPIVAAGGGYPKRAHIGADKYKVETDLCLHRGTD